ncbi:MAG TPA: RNA polymerase sigma factor, partial [Acidimicrobiia bacterium]|nr:RNA polymerase sigma factor [Acidimicrobiia bacterium]
MGVTGHNSHVGTAALAARVRAGDQSAFAELYNDYAERLFGFCVVLLRDRDEAADATHDTFVLAAQRVHQLRDLDRLRPWLFAIARHVCYRRIAQRKRSTPTEIEPDVLVLDEDPDARLSAEDAAALVWAAAASLNERDRAVLDLSLREGLEGADLAAALGVEQANPHSLLYRAKEQLEGAIGVLVVARAGRSSCPTLAGMLRGWDGTLTPIVRKRLGRHMNRCVTCLATRSRALPVSALAVAPMLKPSKAQAWSPQSDETTLTELLQIAQRRPESEERWQDDGLPPLAEPSHQRRRRAAFLVVGVVGVVLVAALTVGELSAGSDSAGVAASNPDLAATRETTASTTVSVTTTTRPGETTTTTIVLSTTPGQP